MSFAGTEAGGASAADTFGTRMGEPGRTEGRGLGGMVASLRTVGMSAIATTQGEHRPSAHGCRQREWQQKFHREERSHLRRDRRDASAAPCSGKSCRSEAPACRFTTGALAADATGALTFAWKITNATNPRVNASAIAADQTLPLGSLDATTDGDPSGNVAACSMKNVGPTVSNLFCGGTPAYNYLTAKLTGGALVITLTRGVDSVPGSEKVEELLRRPTNATSLHATGPASPLLSGNCRPGHVQRTPESACLRQCLKGNECKGTDSCTMVSVTGGDGPHKVHACVPASK